MTELSVPLPGSAPAFTDAYLPEAPRAITLVLHGGAEHGEDPVDSRSLSWRRGRGLTRHISPILNADRIGAVLLRYRVRGWNATPGVVPPPVADARWALDQIRERHDLPVVVVGHSMGGRTGVAVADDPSVRGVVGLAPWLPVDEPVAPLAGKVLRAAHGRRDRITSPKATRAFVERAGEIADADFTDMGRVGHYLLRQVPLWNAVTVASVREILSGE